jgi:hypothetical protein
MQKAPDRIVRGRHEKNVIAFWTVKSTKSVINGEIIRESQSFSSLIVNSILNATSNNILR